jgi:hypothetical protein
LISCTFDTTIHSLTVIINYFQALEMSLARLSAVATLVSTVVAHGIVTGFTADGVSYTGWTQAMPYMKNPPAIAAWSTTVRDTGFVGPVNYTTPDIICHMGAKPGAIHAPVKAGGKIELTWSGVWPESHHGPVIGELP